MFHKILALIKSSKSTYRRAFYLVVPLAVSLIILTFGAVLVVSATETTDSTITVCPEGPPQCDHQTIQAGIDAASHGDAILVSSGIYTENITLKTGISLNSTDGPTTTIVTDENGPLVTAQSVHTATMQGFTIRGQGQMSSAIGMLFDDSNVSITSTVIEELHSRSYMPESSGNHSAIGIIATGSGSLRMTGVAIRDLTGGEQDVCSWCDGWGDAIGVKSSGSISLVMTNITLNSLDGGSGHYYSGGGAAIGIDSEGNADITLQGSRITGLLSGWIFSYCPPVRLPAIGLRITGGYLSANRNYIGGFGSDSPQPSAVAFRLKQMSAAYINGNVIGDFSSSNLDTNGDRKKLNNVPCGRRSFNETGIWASQIGDLAVIENSFKQFRGSSIFGLRIQDSLSRIENNTFDSVSAGGLYANSNASVTAAAIYIEDGRGSIIVSNEINDVRGGRGYYAWPPGMFEDKDGGNAAGISVSNDMQTEINNNIVNGISGGSSETDFGGEAYGLLIDHSYAHIYNNTLKRTFGGIANDGIPAASYGVVLTDSSFAVFVNNIVSSHETGIRVDPSTNSIVDYQGLWNNNVNYVGTPGGAHDVIANPGFVNASAGDLHLRPDSPLIDSGSNLGAPNQDFETEPRPLDGDEDGIPITDIGADEFWLGLLGSYKSSSSVSIEPGGIYDYYIAVINPSPVHSLSDVNLSDTLPLFTTYVTNTLAASSGSALISNDTLFWHGHVAPDTTITITFQVKVEPTLEGPYAIVNLAMLNDNIGLPLTLRSLVLVDPLVIYLPIISQQ